MAIVAVRAAPEFASTRYLMAPFPAPLASESWIQDASVDADHLHSALVCTAMTSVRSEAPMLSERGEMTKLQLPGCCGTEIRLPSMTIAPTRIAGVGLAVALNVTVACPRPLAGLRPVIHSDALDAVHEQSAVADTAIVDVPPAPARLSAGGAALTEHFVDDGLVDVDVLAPQPDATTALSKADAKRLSAVC
jgi:hypothetical protein